MMPLISTEEEATNIFDFPKQFSKWLHSKPLGNSIGMEKDHIGYIINNRMLNTGFIKYIDGHSFALDAFIVNPKYGEQKTIYLASGFIETDKVNDNDEKVLYGLKENDKGYLIKIDNNYDNEIIIIREPLLFRLLRLHTICDDNFNLQEKFKEYKTCIFKNKPSVYDDACGFVKVFQNAVMPKNIITELVEVSRQNKIIMVLSKLVKNLYGFKINNRDAMLEILLPLQEDKTKYKLLVLNLYNLITFASIYHFIIDKQEADEDEIDRAITHVIKSYYSLTDFNCTNKIDLDYSNIVKTIKYIVIKQNDIHFYGKDNLTVQMIMLHDYVKKLNRRTKEQNDSNNK